MVPSPTCSPLNSIGAASFSPSPMTTMPSIGTVESTVRIASTAALSAPFLSPRPTQRDADSAADSVTRTSSRARLRSGCCGDRLGALPVHRTFVSADGETRRLGLHVLSPLVTSYVVQQPGAPADLAQAVLTLGGQVMGGIRVVGPHGNLLRGMGVE